MMDSEENAPLTISLAAGMRELVKRDPAFGNPTSESLFKVIGHLQQHAGVHLAVVASAGALSAATASHN